MILLHIYLLKTRLYSLLLLSTLNIYQIKYLVDYFHKQSVGHTTNLEPLSAYPVFPQLISISIFLKGLC